MNYLTILGLFIFLLGTIVARAIMTKALMRLDDAAKLSLLEFSSKRNLRRSIIFVGYVVVYFAGTFLLPSFWFFFLISFFSAILIHFIISFVLNYRRLQQLPVSRDYLASYYKANILTILATLVMAGFVIYSFLRIR